MLDVVYIYAQRNHPCKSSSIIYIIMSESTHCFPRRSPPLFKYLHIIYYNNTHTHTHTHAHWESTLLFVICLAHGSLHMTRIQTSWHLSGIPSQVNMIPRPPVLTQWKKNRFLTQCQLISPWWPCFAHNIMQDFLDAVLKQKGVFSGNDRYPHSNINQANNLQNDALPHSINSNLSTADLHVYLPTSCYYYYENKLEHLVLLSGSSFAYLQTKECPTTQPVQIQEWQSKGLRFLALIFAPKPSKGCSVLSLSKIVPGPKFIMWSVAGGGPLYSFQQVLRRALPMKCNVRLLQTTSPLTLCSKLQSE